MRETVVLVHGIWMTGLDLVPLRWRLEQAGFACRIFRYPSLRRTPVANAGALRTFLDQVEGETLHFVGHSLGGVVLLHLFAAGAVARAGRVVFLGSPVQGSAVARVLAARSVTRPFIGRSGDAGLFGGTPGWAGACELGTIAGARPLGVGRVLGGITGPSDGTVAVRETFVRGAAGRVTLPVTHTGLVFSSAVAAAAIAFLRTGSFGARQA